MFDELANELDFIFAQQGGAAAGGASGGAGTAGGAPSAGAGAPVGGTGTGGASDGGGVPAGDGGAGGTDGSGGESGDGMDMPPPVVSPPNTSRHLHYHNRGLWPFHSWYYFWPRRPEWECERVEEDKVVCEPPDKQKKARLSKRLIKTASVSFQFLDNNEEPDEIRQKKTKLHALLLEQNRYEMEGDDQKANEIDQQMLKLEDEIDTFKQERPKLNMHNALAMAVLRALGYQGTSSGELEVSDLLGRIMRLKNSARLQKKVRFNEQTGKEESGGVGTGQVPWYSPGLDADQIFRDIMKLEQVAKAATKQGVTHLSYG